MRRAAHLIIDLGFGDSGKGTMVDYLVRRHEADLVVRFNGGPQGGHNVVLPDGRHHTFAQFGSGSFVPGVRTLLSRFMLIEPYAMLNEAAHLQSIGVSDCLSRTFIDERCLIITPPQQIANRIRERARGKDAHGTCGMGVGETVADSIAHPELSLHAADFRDPSLTRRKLQAILEHKRCDTAPLRNSASADELRVLDDDAWIETASDIYHQVVSATRILSPDEAALMIREPPVSIFEGAQGVLLDERYGFHPHTTWSKTTFTNADALLDESQFDGSRNRIGVMRAYMTRHGAGPFVTEDHGLSARLPEPHNGDTGWQGHFRRGVLDLVMLRYALKVCGGVDSLALTHLDQLPNLPAKVCDAYEMDSQRCGEVSFPSGSTAAELQMIGRRLSRAKPIYRRFAMQDADAFVGAIEERLAFRIIHGSYGPSSAEKWTALSNKR